MSKCWGVRVWGGRAGLGEQHQGSRAQWRRRRTCPVGLVGRVCEGLCGREKGKFSGSCVVEAFLKVALRSLNCTSRK